MNQEEKDQVLLEACNLYSQGKFKDCITTLNKVCFMAFDLKEWEYENNRLLCYLKMSKTSDSTDHLSVKFQALLEKVKGLPSQPETLSLVISVGLNYSFVLLSQHSSGKAFDSHIQAGELLTDNILQAAEVFNCPCRPNILKGKPFASNVLNDVLDIVEKLLSQTAQSDLITLNCCVLAVLWISQHQVDEGFKLLNILKNHLESSKGVRTTTQHTIIVDPSIAKQRFPLCLLTYSNEQGFCLNTSILFLMALILKVFKSDNQKALNLLQVDHNISSFHHHYLKGLIFYENNELDESLKSFHNCMNMLDSTQSCRAAALCNAGYCLFKKGKPNMAIAKFKEAMSCDFEHLDALFYIAEQQKMLGKHDAEIQSLHLLHEALSAQRKTDIVSFTSSSLLQGPFISFVCGLHGKTISLEYVNYWLGKRCLQLHRFSEASDALIDVISAATLNECHKMQVQNLTKVLPPPMYLYRDCAFAMVKANKARESVIICDHGIKVSEDLGCLIEANDRVKKRQREASGFPTNVFLELMLCKALAVFNLHQPLISLQILQRVFDNVESSLRFSTEDKELDSRLRKRRKIGSDGYGVDVIDEILQDDFYIKNDEKSCLFEIKSQAHMIRANVLQNLNKEKDCLEELYQSLICNPDNIAAVYHYTKLIFKLGSKNVAASNWIKYKELRHDGLFKKSKTLTDEKDRSLPFLFDITDKEIQVLDNMASRFR